MILLPNVYIDILRSAYTSAGGTDSPRPHLQRVEAHLTRIKDAVLTPLSTSAFESRYEIYTDVSVDIQKGDVIANIIRKDNNKPFFGPNQNEMYRVTDAVNSSPGQLEYRDCSLGRYVGGGPIR